MSSNNHGVESTLNRLTDVGENKPMGYLSATGIRANGETIDGLCKVLEAKGLKVFFIEENDESLGLKSKRFMHDGGFLVAYHKKALSDLIKKNVTELRRAKWPLDTDGFAHRACAYAVTAPIQTGNPVRDAVTEALSGEPASKTRALISPRLFFS